MLWPDLPYDPRRKRFYLVAEDLSRNPSDYEVFNEDKNYPWTALLPDGQTFPITTGARRLKLPGSAYESWYGLPNLLVKPRVLVARQNKPLDIYGFHTCRVISTRAKQLLCKIDAAAFDFVECDTVTRTNLVVEPYWMIDIARLVYEFDEARSVFELAKGVDGVTGEPYEGPHVSLLHDIPCRRTYRLSSTRSYWHDTGCTWCFDHVLADAWREHRFTGTEWVPLQPATPRERRRRGYTSFIGVRAVFGNTFRQRHDVRQ
jgi:hypothetical protein